MNKLKDEMYYEKLIKRVFSVMIVLFVMIIILLMIAIDLVS